MIARASEWHSSFQSVELSSFPLCFSVEVRSTERTEPRSPMEDAQNRQDTRVGGEDLFGEEGFKGSE